MNKKMMLDAMKDLPDDAEIYIWSWQSDGAHIYFTNPTLNQPDDCLLILHERCRAYDCTKEWEAAHTKDHADDLLRVCSWCSEMYDPEVYGADEDYCSEKCRCESERNMNSHEGN